MILSCHQPQMLPYLGFWDKLMKSDVHVVMDNIAATRADFTNRNKIRTPQGWMWLTIPLVSKNMVKINEIEINNFEVWRSKHWKSIESSYGKAKFWEKYSPIFSDIYDSDWDRLLDFDSALFEAVCGIFNINIPIIALSRLNVEGIATERIINICKAVGADTYLSGSGGRDYLDENRFNEENIKLVYQEFEHPKYKQQFKGFVKGLSIIDWIFNRGDKRW